MLTIVQHKTRSNENARQCVRCALFYSLMESRSKYVKSEKHLKKLRFKIVKNGTY